MSSLDVCVKLLPLGLYGAHSSQALNAEQNFGLEITIFFEVVVVKLFLKIVFMGEISLGGVGKTLKFLHCAVNLIISSLEFIAKHKCQKTSLW